MSGRKGLGVKADDLLDLLEQKAFAEVDRRNPDLPLEAKRRIATQIACGALRYFMLKFALNSMIVFDVDDALSFEGETGPYLMYTVGPSPQHITESSRSGGNESKAED